MRVLIIDTDSCGLDIAYRAAEAGHEVKWWMPPNEDHSPIMDGSGFPGVEKVPSWRNHGAWAKEGVIINLFNDRKITAELDRWRAFGLPVFGPSVKSSSLEWNRGKGMELFKKRGIEIPHYEEFTTLDEAIKFAWKADRPYVFKTIGDEEDKSLTYVPDDPKDLVGWLETHRAHGLKLKGPCILQEKVKLIAEVGVSGWMGRDGFLPEKWNVNFEHKKLMPGDHGPNTGEMGTVCKYTTESTLAELVLAPFEKDLMSMGHIGDVDVNCGIKENGEPLPFEWCNRFGWPSTQILFASHIGDPIEWMRDALKGKDTLSVDYRTAIGVLMARPPFPNKNDDPQSSVGYVISGIEEMWQNVSPWQMMIENGPVEKDGKLVLGPVYKTTGDYVCVVTSLGDDVHDVVSHASEIVKHIKFSDCIVRNDIGKKLEKELPKLHALGYHELPHW